jgi:serine protease inhibitor
MHEDYFDYVRDYDDQNRAKVSLNNKDALGMEFAASINNYDIVKVLGEDKIRNTVKAAYEKCLAEYKNQYECEIAESSIDEYLDNYIQDINKNYGKVDASTGFKMYVGDDVKMFAKNFKEYDGTTLQYVSIMPTSGTLGEFIENTSLDKLKTLIGSLKEIKSENFADGKVTRISGVVPEYDYKKDYSLIDEFRQLGVEKVFTSDADLSKMLEEDAEGVKVVKINHSAKIQFTNFGVKAAAATSVVGAGAAGPGFDYLFDVPVEEIDLTFDKPFLYMIRDTKTGEIWFMGTVYEGKEYK